jgi:hypothetical protein
MNNSQEQKASEGPRRTPAEIAALVRLYVRSFIVIVYWVILGLIAAAGGAVVLAGAWWALRQIRSALGF